MVKLCLALDTADINKAWKWCDETKASVDILKIGSELFSVYGTSGCNVFHQFEKPIFLDLKLHDIPNTVYNTVRNLASLNPYMISVHTECVSEAKRASDHYFDPKKPLIMAVTALSSDRSNKWIHLCKTYRNAKIALLQGADGLICSPATTKWIRRLFPDAFILTPGIRLLYERKNDQQYVATPEQAVKNGANIIVVGRSITNHINPRWMAKHIKEIMKGEF